MVTQLQVLIESIGEKLNQHKETRETNEQRHKDWNTAARRSLRDVLLGFIRNGTLPGWELSEEDSTKIVQAVTLRPPAVTSYSTTDLHYGKLIFCPIHNGKIVTASIYPRYGDAPEKAHLLGTVNPDELTPELIAKHVRDFIADLTRWEQSNNADTGNPE